MNHISLTHYDDFKKVLSDYQMSDRAKTALSEVNLVLIVGPASTGKNTLIKHLINTGKYYFIVSDTTRPPQFRDGAMEENGVQYFFRSEEQVLDDLKNGEFLEAAIIHEQQVSGISIRELEKAKSLNKVAVADVEIVGVENIKNSNPNVIAIFLVPPSFEEWQRRMHGKTVMTEKEIDNRMQEARRGIKHALNTNYYQYIVSENIDESVRSIDDIVHGKANLHQDKARETLIKLEKELEDHFNN